MKRFYAILLAGALLLALAGCGIFGKEKLLSPGKTEPEAEAGVLIRKDKEELVEVQIADGAATLSFNLERWNTLYGIREYAAQNYPDFTLPEGASQVMSLSGRVKDACIGKISSMNQEGDVGFVVPDLLLLMEDGRLEWLPADPFNAEHHSWGTLPWLGSIVALSYESDREGMGRMTIFAEDADGARYDVRIPRALMGVFDYEWICGEIGNVELSLDFEEGGSVTLGKGLASTYKIALAEGSQQRPGVISFEFAGKTGMYFTECDGFLLKLYPAEGDDVFSQTGEPADVHEFWQPMRETDFHGDDAAIEDMTEEALINYLTACVEEAYERMYEMRGPLTARVPGDTTDLPDEGACRDVLLGTEMDGKFTLVIRYTIAPSGAVYEYFPDDEEWGMMYQPGAVG